MRVLHLFSNKRWTGPAEPAANLAAGLARAGLDVTFACAAAGDRLPHRMAREARDRGLDVRTDLRLPKHFRPLDVARDARAVAGELADGRYDLLHCHQPVDHCVAGWARRRAGAALPIVRSLYEPAGLGTSWLDRRVVPRCTDALCVPAAPTRDAVVAGGALPADRVHVVDGAVDTDRFTRDRPLPDLRAQWGFGSEHVVFGVVARMQPYRRFDVLLEGLRRAVPDAPHARLVLVGRGTRAETVAHQPVRELGLSDAVHFAGYLTGDDFVAALAAFDAFIFLVPGSDGTCRAVREALAMGVPVLAARRGILPWLVEDGRTGLVIDDTADNIAAGIRRLACDTDLRRALRGNAAAVGPTRFALTRQVETVRAIYEAVSRG